MLIGEKINGLHVVKGVEMVQAALVVSEKDLIENDLWHKRLSHISTEDLQVIAK